MAFANQACKRREFMFGCYRWLVNLFLTHQCKLLTILSFTVNTDNKVQLRKCDGSEAQFWTIIEHSDGRYFIMSESSRGTLFKFSESN